MTAFLMHDLLITLKQILNIQDCHGQSPRRDSEYLVILKL